MWLLLSMPIWATEPVFHRSRAPGLEICSRDTELSGYAGMSVIDRALDLTRSLGARWLFVEESPCDYPLHVGDVRLELSRFDAPLNTAELMSFTTTPSGDALYGYIYVFRDGLASVEIVAHELLHAQGVKHSKFKGDLMFSSLDGLGNQYAGIRQQIEKTYQ